MGGKSGSAVIGYNYFFGIHMGISRGPVDELVEIKVGDRTAWPEAVTDPNAEPPEGPELTREYPPTINALPPFLFFGGPTWAVQWAIESPMTFVPGATVTIENLVRYVPTDPPGDLTPILLDLSGDYTILERSEPIPGSSDSPYVSGTLTIAVTAIEDWTKFVNFSLDFPDEAAKVPDGALPIIFSVDTDTTGGVGEISDTATESCRIYINAPELFGGEHSEGGVQGPMDVMMGEDTQLCGTDLKTMLGGTAPGFRGMFTAFYDGLVSSLNPYPKPWKFRVRRAKKGWDGDVWEPDLAIIKLTSNLSAFVTNVKSVGDNAPPVSPADGDTYILGDSPTGAWAGNAAAMARWASGAWTFYTPQDGWTVYALDEQVNYLFADSVWALNGNPDIHAMNPAHIVYECLTNRAWGRGLPRSKIDEDAFAVAAQTLFDESFGLCLRWSRRDSIESFVQMILDHIGATLYENRTTAKIVLKLIRGGYDVNDLPLFDSTSGLVEVREANVLMGGSYVNEMRVKYIDPVTDKERTVRVDNLASIQANGGEFVSVEKNYPGLPTPQLASRVAQRDLRAAGIELRRFTVVLDRRAWQLVPGDVFRIRDSVRGIRDTVVRAGKIEDGTITEGKITITAIQDVFALPLDSFIGNQGATTVTEPAPCNGDFELFEVPYVLLAGRMPLAELNALDDTGFLGVAAERGDARNKNYDIAVRGGLPEDEDQPEGPTGFCGFLYERYRIDMGGLGTTACYLDPQDAQDEALAMWNDATGESWSVKTDYFSKDVSNVPVATRFVRSEVVTVGLPKWKESVYDYTNPAFFFDTLEDAAQQYLDFWKHTFFQPDGVTERAIQNDSFTIDYIEAYTITTSGYVHVQVAHGTYYVERFYGYLGDTDPPGFYPTTHALTIYNFLVPTDETVINDSGEKLFVKCED